MKYTIIYHDNVSDGECGDLIEAPTFDGAIEVAKSRRAENESAYIYSENAGFDDELLYVIHDGYEGVPCD